MELEGRVAVVTGASSGIGFALAAALVARSSAPKRSYRTWWSGTTAWW